MKNRMKQLTALFMAVTLCAGTVYAESETNLAGSGTETTEAVKETQTEAAAQAEEEPTYQSEQETKAEPETTPQTEPIQTEASQEGEGQTEASQEGVSQEGEGQTEASQAGTSQEDEGQTETSQTGTSQEDEGQTEVSQEGMSQEGEGQTEVSQNGENQNSAETDTSVGNTEEADTESSGTASEAAEKIKKKKEKASEEEEPEGEEKEALVVKTEQGETLALQEIKGPEKLTSGGKTYSVDYEEGVYCIQVPEDTKVLQITVPDQTDGEEVSLTKWSGYLVEVDKTWLLCPDDPVEGAFSEAGNTYTVNLEKFGFEVENVSLEQMAVYGDLTYELDYAEIFVYSEERSEVILVEYVPAETLNEENAESNENEAVDEAEDSENTAGDETGDSELAGELDTQVSDVTETAAELETETESESELYLEVVESAEEAVMTLAASQQSVDSAYAATGKNLADSAATYTPTVASINGEWQILGLARSGQEVDASVYLNYLANVVSTLEENNGVLHEKIYTVYSRVILALTSLGYDVTDVAGYNLLQPLSDFDQTVWQGVNGAVFALIALDSHNYEIPTAEAGKTQNSREKLVEHILSLELSGGGWDLSGNSADPDVTAMALQSLAPYYNTDSAVKSAVDRGVAKLSSIQKSDGSYSTYGSKTSESCSQVIVALTALGIDPNTDSRFIKNGKSVVDALLAFAQSDGSFKHVMSGGSDQMATEQAYYALTAYQRFVNGENRLYDMTDVAIKSDYEKAATVEELISALPGTVTLSNKSQIEAAQAMYSSLNDTQKGLISSSNVTKLQNAVAKLQELEAAQGETSTSTGTSGSTSTGSSTGSSSSSTTKVASGTTKQVNLVSSSSRTGGTSSGTSSYVKSSTSSGTAASGETKEDETETETGDEKSTKTGGTKSDKEVTSLISSINALFKTSKTSAKLPESPDEYTDAQVNSIVEIYRTFLGMDKEKQQAVEASSRYQDYLEVLDKMKAENHYDEATDTDLRDNGEEVLPWYIQMQVSPMLVEEGSASAVKEALKGQGELLTMSDINLVDLLEGGEWQPEDLVRVRIPETGKDSYENLAIVHMKDDGSMEFIEAHISGAYLEFDTDHFSRFGIVGYNGSMEELMQEQEEEQIWMYLVPGAGAAALLVLLLLVRIISSRKKKA